jgi:hypothetical protein
MLRETPFDRLRPNRDVAHPHMGDASERSRVNQWIDRIALESGRIRYDIQSSDRLARSGTLGTRVPFNAKDLKSGTRMDPVPDRALLTLVDVDYYVDLPTYLGGVFGVHPLIAYTIQPENAGGIIGHDSSYFWRNNGDIHMDANGAAYEHSLWSFCDDHVTVPSADGGYIVYDVDVFQVSSGRVVVAFTPAARTQIGLPSQRFIDIACAALVLTNGVVPLTAGLLAVGSRLIRKFFVPTGNELKRLNPVTSIPAGGGQYWVAMEYVHNSVPTISIGITGQRFSATLPAAAYNTICVNISLSKGTPNRGGVISILKTAGLDNAEDVASLVIAAALAEVRTQTFLSNPMSPCPPKTHYLKSPPTYKDNLKEFGTVLMPAILTPGPLVPFDDHANDAATFKGRIKDVENKSPLTPQIRGFVNEFVSLIIPTPGQLGPYTPEQASSGWVRPTQVAETSRWWMWSMLPTPIRAFMKKESYAKFSDPRNISPVAGPEKVGLSRFIQPIADYVKQFDWYAFGRSPESVARRVSDILTDGKPSAVIETDFTRFDGTVGEALRYLERTLLFRAFGEEYHRELKALHARTHSVDVVMRSGIKYNSKKSRLSGMPETSVFNGVDNAFVAFVALRHTIQDGHYLSAPEAFDILTKSGLFGGDDGLVKNVLRSDIEWAAKALGLIIKPNVVSRGDPVTFLGRWYGPGTWYGDPTTTADIPRQLAKFNVTFAAPNGRTPLEMLRLKVDSFLINDRHTPVLGRILCALDRRLPRAADDAERDIGPYHVVHGDGTSFPNSDVGWSMSFWNPPPEWVGAVEAWCESNVGSVDDWISEFPTLDRMGPLAPEGTLVGEFIS